MTSGPMWLGILGTAIIVIMLAYKKRSAFVCGIMFVTIVSWFRHTAVSYFPDTDEGDARFDYFRQVVRVEPLRMVVANYTGNLGEVFVAMITFLYVDFLDTTVSNESLFAMYFRYFVLLISSRLSLFRELSWL